MPSTCRSCGFQNPSDMRFCGNCGTPIEQGNVAIKTGPLLKEMGVMVGASLAARMQKAGLQSAGQRRTVTVLFADLSGYTALSEEIDSEDVYEIVQQFVQLMLRNVYKYEGIVDKLTGDGLMALFGAPISYENNAERAVRASLDMQMEAVALSREVYDRFDGDLRLRIGLHSGEVIVGGVGSDSMMDYTAIGDTVNLAHRIEEAAPPGTILVSESVYRQTRATFDFQQISAINPKGVGHPVVAYGVIGTKERPGRVRGLEGLHAPMVGREAELEQLQRLVSDLVEGQQGHFTFIVGEAGLGKSRLTAEFKETLVQYPVRVLEGQSLVYRRSVSYWIFQDVIYSYLGLPNSTPERSVHHRLVQHVNRSLGNRAGEILPLLEGLLSLEHSDPQAADRLRYLDSGQYRQQLFFAIRDLLIAETRHYPLLLVLEDLHWADEASLELLHFLMESISQHPIMVLAVTRDASTKEFRRITNAAQNQLGDRFSKIELHHLSPDQSERLLYQLVSIPSIPGNMRKQILERAAGNPFYLEEILRMMIDEGVLRPVNGHWEVVTGVDLAAFGVPDTLQGLILTRFDRLPSLQKRVLKVASVIGKNFSLPVLCAVLKPLPPEEVVAGLNQLVEREFVQLRHVADRADFTFRHILMSDAISGTLLRRERSILHGQVAESIERLYKDRLDTQVELLANHYALSPFKDRALYYLLLAGEKAARNNAIEQARTNFEASVKLLGEVTHTPSQAMRTHLGLGDVLIFAGEYPAAREHFQQAILVSQNGSRSIKPEQRSRLFRRLARTYERQGDYEQARAELSHAQELLERSGNPSPVERAKIWNDLGWIDFRRGNYPEAQQRLQDALELVEDSDDYDIIASVYNRLGGVAYNLGDWDVAAGYLRKSIAIRESIQDTVGLGTSYNNLGLIEVEMGEFDNALENLTRSYELKDRAGQPEGLAMALSNIGWLQVMRGELKEARDALQRSLELTRQIGYSSLHWEVLKNFGQLSMAEGQWDTALDALSQITEPLAEQRAYDQLADAYRLTGETCLLAGDLRGAVTWGQKAQGLLDQLGTEGEELSAVQVGELRRFQGMLATKVEDWDSAIRYLRESSLIFQRLRSRFYQGKVAYQMGIYFEAQGDRRGAQLRFREAALLFQSVGARLEEQRAEEARKRTAM